jgi:transcriptional regulator with XRE-family HTH domain
MFLAYRRLPYPTTYMDQTIRPMFRHLNKRRQRLGMSYAVLAKRIGISLRSVRRILSGGETNAGISTVASLARELGVSVRFVDEVDVRTMRRRQAERKTKRILAIVQGSSALEARSLSRKTMRDLREKTINELLAGSDRKLWAD